MEGLARVDVVCLDKTGTLTEGIVEFERIEILDPNVDADEVAASLAAMSSAEGGNATQDAIAGAFPAPSGWSRDGRVPFSSARKWSAASYEGHGAWVLGAPEMVWLDASDPVRRQADELAATGNRVLLLARAETLADEELPKDLHAVALVLLEEKVRPDAAETLDYFHQQGVALKVISGDNPRTVGAVARRVGLPDAGEPVDARELPEDIDELAEVLEHHSVFGRVTPQQKRQMVKALQSRGHVVAMTGDGVNDALALKDADIGVAMGIGCRGDPSGGAAGVARQPVLDPARRRRRGPTGDREHRAGLEPLPDQDHVRGPAGDPDRDHRLAVPVPAPPPDDRERPHDRHPGVLPRVRTEQHSATCRASSGGCCASRFPPESSSPPRWRSCTHSPGKKRS